MNGKPNMLYAHFTEKLLALQGANLKDSETAFTYVFPPTQQTSSHLAAAARSSFLFFRLPQRLPKSLKIVKVLCSIRIGEAGLLPEASGKKPVNWGCASPFPAGGHLYDNAISPIPIAAAVLQSSRTHFLQRFHLSTLSTIVQSGFP